MCICAEQDSNGDLNADSIRIDAEFQLDLHERISHVQGIFMFKYEVPNSVLVADKHAC